MSLIFLLLALSALLLTSSAQNGLEEVPCYLVANRGRDVYDLSPLRKKAGSSDWKVTSGDFIYYLNVCRELNLKDANPGVGAFETSPNQKYPLGVITTSHLQFIGANNIRVNYAAGDFGLCTARIDLSCGQSVGKPVYGGKLSDCGHYFNWTSSAGCAQPASIENCQFDGYYFDEEDGCIICPENAACNDGIRVDCEDGQYSEEGSTECLAACADGEYPAVPHTPASCRRCEAGYLCRDGLLSTCPTGQYPVEGLYCHLTVPATVMLVLVSAVLVCCFVTVAMGMMIRSLKGGNGGSDKSGYKEVPDEEKGREKEKETQGKGKDYGSVNQDA